MKITGCYFSAEKKTICWSLFYDKSERTPVDFSCCTSDLLWSSCCQPGLFCSWQHPCSPSKTYLLILLLLLDLVFTRCYHTEIFVKLRNGSAEARFQKKAEKKKTASLLLLHAANTPFEMWPKGSSRWNIIAIWWVLKFLINSDLNGGKDRVAPGFY